MVAVSWYWFLLPPEISLPLIPASVLALSVWLTYLADRLLDIRQKEPSEINSLRHRIIAQNQKILRSLWGILFLINLMLAFFGLSEAQLTRGFFLLLVTLGYVLAAQKVKSPLHWKEFSVGIIFTCGVLLFIRQPLPWTMPLMLIILFSCNCQIVAEIDRLKSPQKNEALRKNHISILINLVLATFLALVFLPIALCGIIALVGLYYLRHDIDCENSRIMADAALMIPPFLYFIWTLLA